MLEHTELTSKRLRVEGIPPGAGEHEVNEHFSQAGRVKTVTLTEDDDTHNVTGVIEMADETEAAHAIAELNGSHIAGSKLRVSLADTNPSWRNSITGRMLVRPTDALVRALVDEGKRRRRLAAFAIFSVVGAGTFWATRDFVPFPADKNRLLVVPLQVRGAVRSHDEYVGNVLAQALAINLATQTQLQIVRYDHAENAEDSPEQRLRTARRQRAGRILTGTVARSGERLYVGVSLLDPSNGRLVWGIHKEGDEADIVPLAAELARQVAEALGTPLPRGREHPTTVLGDLEMRRSVETMRAVGALRREQTAAALRASQKLVERFEADRAAWLIRAHSLTLAWEATGEIRHRNALLKALQVLDDLDPQNPYTTIYRGIVARNQRDDAEAVALLTDVLGRNDLSPKTRAWVLRERAWAHVGIGRSDHAERDLENSLNLDPTSASALSLLSELLLKGGQVEESLLRARQSVALLPTSWRGHHSQGRALAALGLHNEAADAFSHACRIGRAQLGCAQQALTLLKAGRSREALEAGQQAESLRDTPEGSYVVAQFWSTVGARDKAMTALRRAVKLGLTDRSLLDNEEFKNLRSDAEFQALATRASGR